MTNTLPALSAATRESDANEAAVAGPPSPAETKSPLPAMVVMMPVTGSTRRMRLLLTSAMKSLPTPSVATPSGNPRLADVAGPPSPLKPMPPSKMPVPA